MNKLHITGMSIGVLLILLGLVYSYILSDSLMGVILGIPGCIIILIVTLLIPTTENVKNGQQY